MNEPVERDLFQVAGDVLDPAGSGVRGTAAGYNFTKTALGHPRLHYRMPGGKEVVLEADVYALPGEPMTIHIICPLCLAAGRTNNLTIRADRKHLRYDHKASVPTFPGWTDEQMRHNFPPPYGAGGLLSVERFGCTWELDPELRHAPGMAVCPWRVVIDNNVVRNV